MHLTAPSGEVWEFNEPNDDDYIRGSAVDFCRTVTQVRNVADTELEVVGRVANEWNADCAVFRGRGGRSAGAGGAGRWEVASAEINGE